MSRLAVCLFVCLLQVHAVELTSLPFFVGLQALPQPLEPSQCRVRACAPSHTHELERACFMTHGPARITIRMLRKSTPEGKATGLPSGVNRSGKDGGGLCSSTPSSTRGLSCRRPRSSASCRRACSGHRTAARACALGAASILAALQGFALCIDLCVCVIRLPMCVRTRARVRVRAFSVQAAAERQQHLPQSSKDIELAETPVRKRRAGSTTSGGGAE